MNKEGSMASGPKNIFAWTSLSANELIIPPTMDLHWWCDHTIYNLSIYHHLGTSSHNKMDFFGNFPNCPWPPFNLNFGSLLVFLTIWLTFCHITQVSSLSDQKLKFAVKSPVYSVFQYILHQLLSYSHLWKDRRIKIDLSDSHSGLLSPVHPFQHRWLHTVSQLRSCCFFWKGQDDLIGQASLSVRFLRDELELGLKAVWKGPRWQCLVSLYIRSSSSLWSWYLPGDLCEKMRLWWCCSYLAAHTDSIQGGSISPNHHLEILLTYHIHGLHHWGPTAKALICKGAEKGLLLGVNKHWRALGGPGIVWGLLGWDSVREAPQVEQK